MTRLILAVVLLVTPPALAAGNEKEATAHYNAGNRAFEEGDFAKAVDEIQQSVAIKPTVKAYLVLGNAYLRLGQLDDSRAAFQKVLEIDPKSSKRKLVEQHIKDLTTLAKTRLAVTTTPPGATIYFDLKAEGSRGKSPAALPALPGRHRVMLELEGYEPVALDAVAVEGQDVPVIAELKQRGCDLTVTTAPEKTELHIDNGPPLTTPITLRVGLGDHVVSLGAAGYLPKSRAVNCPTEKQAVTVNEALEKPPTSTLIVRTSATVKIDGLGVADPGKIILPPGKHEVALEAPGMAPWRTSLTLQNGQEMELSPQLDTPAAPPKKTILLVSSGIPFAQASIDGTLGPVSVPREVAPGTHLVEVRARGYEPFQSQVNVGEGEERLVSTHLGRRGVGALTAGLAFSMLTLGAAGATVAAHYSANRELPTSQAYSDWHNVELAGIGMVGGFGGLALICFITGAVQASTGGPGTEWTEQPKLSWTGNGVAGKF
jgi:hypothetical protein